MSSTNPGVRLLQITLILALCLVGTHSFANIDRIERQAIARERARDCEGAYKKFLELQTAARKLRSARQRRNILSFVATKLSKWKRCYEKCTPSEREKELLEKAKGYEKKGHVKRAYRMLLRLTRGKNPRCTSWKEAHAMRKDLAKRQPRRRGKSSVDPCERKDETNAELQKLESTIQELQKKITYLKSPPKIPPAPKPPRWAAKSKRRTKYWLRRWKRRQRRKLWRNYDKIQSSRIQQANLLHRKISSLREKLTTLREDFKDCDKLYTKLKSHSVALSSAQDGTQEVAGKLYQGRLSHIKGKMRWYSRKYWKLRKNQKTDQQTIEALKSAMQQQRDLLDSVTQDLNALSRLLVFNPGKKKEGSLFGDNLGALQKLMSNQTELFKALKKKYPQYVGSEGGVAALKQHRETLERFQKVLENLQSQNPGEKGDKLRETLQKVNASIVLFEKAEQKFAGNPLSAKQALEKQQGAQKSASGGFSLGWLLLLIGFLLGGGALFYLWREKRNTGYEKF